MTNQIGATVSTGDNALEIDVVYISMCYKYLMDATYINLALPKIELNASGVTKNVKYEVSLNNRDNKGKTYLPLNGLSRKGIA